MKFALLLIFVYEYFSWYYKPINQMYFEPWKFKFECETEKSEERKTTVVAVDFDNTICSTTQYPNIDKPIPPAMDVLRVLMNDPYTILILCTCR